MNGSITSKRLLGLAAGVATLILLAGAASAQTYGSVSLSPGFRSQMLSGVSGGQPGVPGGEIDASAYGSTPTGACRGYIAAAPDHTMTLVSPFSSLSVAVTATDGGDTALVVSGPGGTWCNDDAVGLDPAITGSFAGGTYNIWVASYSMGSNHPYTITFSEAPATPPATPPAVPIAPPPATPPSTGMMTTSMVPTDSMGQIVLSTGFLPDPQTRMGTVTGVVDLNMTPNLFGGTCRGYVQPNPDHIMNLTTAFTYLRVHVRSSGDMVMAIQDPTGGFWCNDDSDGLNPVIDGPWQPGLWRIWVGTYSPGATSPYTIDFTEYPR